MSSFKRSVSDTDALTHMSEDSTLENDISTPKSRPSRAFSWTKLTESMKGRRQLSRSRTSLDKCEISSPVIITGSSSPQVLLGLPLPPLVPLSASPSVSVSTLPTAYSSPGSRKPRHTAATHSYSASDPTNNHSPPDRQRRSLSRSPPQLAAAPSFGSISNILESPLERIAESPLEHHRTIVPLNLNTPNENLSSMEPMRLQPPATAMVGTKGRAMLQAQETEALVAERAKRSGDEPPPYDFYELIGKGAYGRVFKGKSRNTGGLVAIKIIDIDRVDYEEMTTKNLSETLKEIDILQQLRDSRARPYVNIIEEARTVHSELWIVSEYASGGSVNTLMKPTAMIKDPGPGLPEKFVIPIARELALGLKYVHEAGVLHRDLKCNNVLILEDGRVQLCDFGVSGTLEPQKSKRTTIVGTPYWMAPELQKEWIKETDPHGMMGKKKEILYGSEVDIWAYGCTVYEMAFGYPPHHNTVQFDLPFAGVPVLEGERFSQELKDFVAYLLEPEAIDRPTADQILEHPYIMDTANTHPNSTLVKLVEDYYTWERQGGARQSLFNPFGAQAPDPLAPEAEDEDNDDWTFSTSDEFEQEHAPQFVDPFTGAISGQGFTGMNMPIADMGRFEQLQARFKEESITRGEQRLNRLFDTESTPYRYSGIGIGEDSEEGSSGRSQSDLVLRDFEPGAPNRETVIDLDFAYAATDEVPMIDLGEVPTIKAGRMKSLLREMEEEEARDALNQENELTTKRATKEWTFPSMSDGQDQSTKRATKEWTFPKEQNQLTTKRATQDWKFPTANDDQSNRKTMEWTFPSQAQKPNRRTVEWTFDAAMAEANSEAPRNRTSRRRDTKEAMRSLERSRNSSQSSLGTGSSFSSSLAPGFRSSQRYGMSELSEHPRDSSAVDSPLRTSMIDLDMAMVEDYRPTTPGSEQTYTASSYTANDNPFNLEDQVQLSQNNHRASFHMKSQSEPNQTVPGLLTPQQYDEQGHLTNQDPLHPNKHLRGVSSASQVQTSTAKPPPPNISHRPNQRSQQAIMDSWSHSDAYNLGSDDQSPPRSVTTDTSLDDEDVDDLWDSFERFTLQAQRRYESYASLRSTRRTDSIDHQDPRSSDTDEPHSSSHELSENELPVRRQSRVSVGLNGRPLVDFPVPRGPDVEALLGSDLDPRVLQDALLKSCVELRDGTRAGRDLLRAMQLKEVPEDEGV
ncbi:hypothetical protein P153DRAFT_414567 [Dothidotthia symphoricarpi CBS 119687]|uniref:non-specific serine/threonine protein kinase n=1 Tax=Dothidotthia symphoricarpi CBS 119687 TaxID=1392245 RepID=A0A6A6ALD0_9PLEO|nr:uncharacterized protein P153DRAFT_414567 [Dothidotthia symphoricarpi CBS 119687]KAF2132759.1 hypothetical protein P153DRAFT_414567 [Dothidotthia symphoricarpi CBS 119687]